MSDREKITGGCLCGAVKFEINEIPLSVAVCHCRMCQRHTGSAFFVGVDFNPETLRWTTGKPQVFKSSKIAERGFCGRCGSTLYLYYPQPPWRDYHKKFIGIAIGALDHPGRWKPDHHCGVESQLSWTDYDDGLPRERFDTDEELKAALE